ncbi:type Z 30S ribosomal protein S14 [Patescibacteria group bacterium]|nr:type Z 30S ribosomal protein S14 [Patescibacteria group bacterium]
MVRQALIERANRVNPKYAKTRKVNRCKICGRGKGYLRDFAICRICFRELASQGMLPGIKKASW